MAASPSQHPSATIDLESAQHVHQVYTYLDRVGVPGDGFHEGIERTREHRRLSALASLTQLAAAAHSDSLSDAEIQILGNADRYGFFKPMSSERVLYLPSDAFYPTPVATTSDPILATSPSSLNSTNHDLLIQETNRIEKWTDMLTASSRDSGSSQSAYQLRPEWNQQRARFEKRCFKGIPDRWRRAAWEMLLAESDHHRQASTRPTIQRLHQQFQALLTTPSEQDVQIDLDVPRTINGHIFFHTRYGKGQRALFQVLHTFGMYCKTCGYCQGMGPIAATLLSYFSAEDAFVCMVRIHDNLQFHNIFSPGFPGLLECFYIQERLIEHLIPAVHATFDKQMISSSAYATKWYITIFANTVPYEAQLRLWDAFFLKGMDVLILAAVSLVYSLRSKIGPGHDFEEILSTLGGRFEMENSFRWLRSIRKLYNRQDIQDLIQESRSQWNSFVRDGSASKRVT
ncbi:hypothetical protein PTTG_06673 [Puccinia triticina 1-1 BBBD Race 1]|uniref:Rab-GAP TBC domain-containing protein n=2 Tax=Puccinia triticina TaxID=208348 RepID=A0A0C4F0Q6_PUCT1|nr:uncharacterized protein PtA15_8A754 [Puccinia triticina]OAV99488.1 hypothetical protein PTTG_06673 [Puccinia triticina 1-1 BBBD Race 1]WAQ87847.1 hypothetical protein PtA15_8A754 [Puccinia triticina]WAR57726.1 hypothetical protein PtB15_8B779 [Puccinia triticina]